MDDGKSIADMKSYTYFRGKKQLPANLPCLREEQGSHWFQQRQGVSHQVKHETYQSIFPLYLQGIQEIYIQAVLIIDPCSHVHVPKWKLYITCKHSNNRV